MQMVLFLGKVDIAWLTVRREIVCRYSHPKLDLSGICPDDDQVIQ